MSKRWMWAVSVLTAVFLVTGAAALFAKSHEDEDERESKISGSVAVPSEEAQLAKMAKVTLVEAIGAAVTSAPGKAIAAELEDDDGSLVYTVDIVTADDKVTEVTVDAGNKKILKTEVDEDRGEEDENEEGEEEDEDVRDVRDVRGKYKHEKGGEDD